MSLELSGSHRSTHIASHLALRALDSHRRPNRSESPNRRHMIMRADISHRRPPSHDFRINFCGTFCDQSKLRGFCIEKIASLAINFILGVHKSNRIAHRAIRATKVVIAKKVWPETPRPAKGLQGMRGNLSVRPKVLS